MEVSWNAIRWYHINENGWKDIGYHIGVEWIGSYYEALLGRMLTESGAHTKENGMNNSSIGICCVGNFDIAPVPASQMDKLIQVTRSMMEIFNIPVYNVQRHSDYATHKSCPGKLFQWDQFKEKLT